jgi:subtilisin family serine protease
MVVRFAPGAGNECIKRFDAAGMRVASSRELAAAAKPPAEELGGADVLYFERFGIAIVQQDPARVRAAMASMVDQRAVASVRPERIFRALVAPSWSSGGAAQPPAASRLSRDYLIGYRDAVDQLVNQMIGANGSAEAVLLEPELEETEATWGLQATRVIESRLSGAGIKVAVLDTGLALDHPDLIGRPITSQSFIPGETVDDQQGHGTHCTGTAIGPLEPAGVPRYGIAYNALIHAGKVLNNQGFGNDTSIIAGIDWALDQGCAIISMSLGADVAPGERHIEDYEVIADICLDAGCLIVAAAGNSSRRPFHIAPVNSPANCPSIMAVAALTPDLQVASFSCGSINPGQAVDIAGPGVDVLSCVPGGHDRFSGTSMATPHVAGIAALYAELDPKFRGRALWAILMQQARGLPGLSAGDVGRGLVQAPR